MRTATRTLKVGGSLWINIELALRNLDNLLSPVADKYGLNVIEWYVLRALYEKDGMLASELARAVGRAATSFTPILDKLQEKGFLERKPHPNDRRAVSIVLTEKGQQFRNQIVSGAEKFDDRLAAQFEQANLHAFLTVLAQLQELDPE